MKVKIEMELAPFTVPNYVLVKEEPKPKQEGFIEGRKLHVSELDADTLDRLCEEFTKNIFEKAGKRRPPINLPG